MTQTSRPRFIYMRFLPLFIGVLMIVATLAVTMALETARKSEQAKEEQLLATNVLTAAKDRLESAIFSRLLLARSLVGFVENRPNVSAKDFALLARDTIGVDEGVMSIWLSYGQEVQYVFPERHWSALLGKPLGTMLPEYERGQLPRLINEASILLGGPVEGSDNRTVFLLFVPVFQKIVGLPGTGPFLGFVVVELNVNLLLRDAKIFQVPIAVRFKDRGTGFIHGSVEYFAPEAETVVGDLVADWGVMQLAVKKSVAPNKARVVWLLGLAVALLLGAASWLTAHQMLQRIRTQEHYRELVHSARSIILRVTPSGVISFFNEYASEFFGYSREEVQGRHLLETISPASDYTGKDVTVLVTDMLSRLGRHEFTEQRNIKKSGEEVWVSWAIRPMYDEHGHLKEVLLAGSDITARRQLEEKLKILATTDSLTGVPNRRHFSEQVKAELTRAQRYAHPFSLLMLDIDLFKSVNDTYGHDIGDVALKSIAATITHTLRIQDICGRVGGEEFCALLLETEKDQALITAERVRGQVEKSEILLPNGEQLCLTVSIGIAVLRHDIKKSETFDQLLKRADMAMYNAKKKGRNRVELG